MASRCSQLPNALSPPTCDFGGGNVFRCYTPGLLRRAYDFPSTTTLNGTGQTILIFDAFGDPAIQDDLALFDAIFGLPAPPSFTVLCPLGCPKTQQAGPHEPQNWAVETALDVEYAHAMAPGASIVLGVSPTSSGNRARNSAQVPGYSAAPTFDPDGVVTAVEASCG